MKIIIFFLFCFALFNLTGCATHEVWKSKPTIKNINKISATSELFYFSCKTNKCKLPKFLIKYKVISNNKYHDTTFPAYPEGYIMIENMDSSSCLYEGLNVLLKEPFESKVISITAKIRSVIRLNKKHHNNMRVDVNVKLPLNPQNYELLKNKNRFLYSFITKRSHSMNENITEGTGFFLLGGPSGGGPSGRANIRFINDLDNISNISINDLWLPLIKNPNTYNFGIIFFEDTEQKIYYKSKMERALLTPFAILLDVATSPFQMIAILSVPLWAPR